ncbi:hypothetical protein BOTCAL_2089g00010 [Botryotinia calthae]|uniref:Rhodopsin domain-containing protein n=1 Tax=Botryotinia calthae TaxID=38488 RepID=A0A4Y8C9X4_9HELO|nr:hypothetical protein BOTCAL_2089g00010 [Botryotinia calthae]
MTVGAIANLPPAALYGISITLTILCIIVSGLRFQVRHVRKAGLQSDDWFVVPALILQIGMGVCVIIGVHAKALGYPTPPGAPGTTAFTATNYEIRTAKQVNRVKTIISYSANNLMKLEWAVHLMQVLSLGAIKLSFLFFFRRIFAVAKYGVFHIASLIMVVLVCIWSIGFFIVFLVACKGDF